MYGIYIGYVTCWAYGYDSLKPYLSDHCEHYKLCSTLYRIIQMYAVQMYVCMMRDQSQHHNQLRTYICTSQ